MAWSDAARAAALEARRNHLHQKAIGKKVTPTTWYHGGPAIKGQYVKPMKSPIVAEAAWATRDFKMARQFSQWRGGKNPATYMVTPSSTRAVKATHWDREKTFGKRRGRLSVTDVLHNFKGTVLSTQQSMRAFRLPRAKGRASRGHY